MDIRTLVVSVISSTAITGIFVFTVKRAIEHSLSTHFDRILHENNAQIDERIRRNARVYDDQYDVLKAIPSLVYRARNTLRDLVNSAPTADTSKRESIRRFHTYYMAIEELLFDNRVLFGEELFLKVHGMKTRLYTVMAEFEELARLTRKKQESNGERPVGKDLQQAYVQINELYLSIVKDIQTILKIDIDSN